MATQKKRKIQVVVSDDGDKFLNGIDDFCKGKTVLEKHYSAQTQFVQQQPIPGLAHTGQVQTVCILHCIIIYEEEIKILFD